MLDDPSEMVGQEDLGCKVVVKCLKVSFILEAAKTSFRDFPDESKNHV